MSPRAGSPKPIKKIRLKIELKGEESSLSRSRSTLKGFRLAEGRLVRVHETSDLSDAIREVARVGEATRDAPKDF